MSDQSFVPLCSSRVWQRPNHAAVHVKEEEDDYLGFAKKQHLIMISVAVGLLVLLIVITVPAVLLTESGNICQKVPKLLLMMTVMAFL